MNKQKSILYLALNSGFSHTNLALRYLKKISDQNSNHSVFLIEYTINKHYQDLIKEIGEFLLAENFSDTEPILVLSAYVWNIEILKYLAVDVLQIVPDLRIFIGGPEVSYNLKNQKYFQKFQNIQILVGQGEANWKLLLKEDFKISEKIIKEKKFSINEIPFPYDEEDIAVKDKLIYYESSRGCAYRCSYCLSSRSDQKLEFRDLKYVFPELDFFIKHKFRIVKFVDRTFNFKQDHYQKIWLFLLEKVKSNSDYPEFHFEIFPELLNEEDFAILKSAPAKLFRLEVGIQSMKKKTLDLINRKNSNLAILNRNLHKLISLSNIHVHLDQIVGLPLEAKNDVISSFNQIHIFFPAHFQMGFLKILPGTLLFEKIEKFALKPSVKPPYEIINSSSLPYQDLLHFQKIENLVETFYNSKHLKKTMRWILKDLFLDCYSFYSKFVSFLENNKVNVLHNFTLEEKIEYLLEFSGSDIFPGDEKLIFPFIFDLLIFDYLTFNAKLKRPLKVLKKYYSYTEENPFKLIKKQNPEEIFTLPVCQGNILQNYLQKSEKLEIYVYRPLSRDFCQIFLKGQQKLFIVKDLQTEKLSLVF